MTRKELVKKISLAKNVSVEDAETIVDSCFDFISNALANGEEVKLMNFGKFEPRKRRAVNRRNPRTGEAVSVPEKVSIGFKPASALKDRVNV